MTDHAPIGSGWQECLAGNEEFYDPGRFVTIPAWESSNAYGHANLFLRTPDVDGGIDERGTDGPVAVLGGGHAST